MIREVVNEAMQLQLQHILPQQQSVSTHVPRKAKSKSNKRARSPSSEPQPKPRNKHPGWTPWGMTLSSPVTSDREEGELSEDEGQSITTFVRADRLCPSDLYPRVLIKSPKMPHSAT